MFNDRKRLLRSSCLACLAGLALIALSDGVPARAEDTGVTLEVAVRRLESAGRGSVASDQKAPGSTIKVLIARYLKPVSGVAIADCEVDLFRKRLIGAFNRHVPTTSVRIIDLQATMESLNIIEDISRKQFRNLVPLLDKFQADLIIWLEGNQMSAPPQTIWVVLNNPRTGEPHNVEVIVPSYGQCSSHGSVPPTTGNPPPRPPAAPSTGREFTIWGYAGLGDRGYGGRVIGERGGMLIVRVTRPSLPFNLNIRPGDECSGGRDIRTLRTGDQIEIPRSCQGRFQ